MPAEKKKPRKKLRPRLLIILVIIVALAFLMTADPLFHLDFGIIRTDRQAASIAVLTEVRDVCALNTVEFIHKSVFPHDFISEDIAWGRLLQKQREGMFLSEEEKADLEVYNLCKTLDISPERRAYDFVVVTSIVKGGFDLKGTVYQNPEDHPELVAKAVSISEDGTISLSLPDPVITEFIIEDSSSSSYTYPDMDIDPEEWKALTGFIQGRVETIVASEGILNTAKERGSRFIEGMLKDAGYKEVIFR